MNLARASSTAAALLIAATTVIVPSAAVAHVRSQSRSSWSLRDDGASVVFVASAYDATRLATDEPFAALPEVYAAHLVRTVFVTRGARPCRIAETVALPSEPGFVRVAMNVVCPAPGDLRVRIDSFFASAPSHVHLADVRDSRASDSTGARDGRDYLFTEASRQHVITRTRAVSADPEAGRAAAALAYVMLGAEHILGGPDHLAFLLALLLLCDGLGAVVFMATGFTIGHSLTLAAAVLGFVDPDARAIEVLIAFTIVVAAVEGSIRDDVTARRAAGACATALLAMAGSAYVAVWHVGPVTWLGLALFASCYLLSRADSTRSRGANALLSALFGLVHGFGFAGALVDMNLSAGRLAIALAGFNVGVEIGQLCVVAAAWACALALHRFLAGPTRAVLAGHAGAILCGLGVFWMLSRSLGG